MSTIDTIENERSWEERLINDAEQTRQNIVHILDEIGQLPNDREMRRLLGDELCTWLRQETYALRKRDQEDFNIVIMGDFKRGKTTFLNALLGQELLKTNVTSETVTINRVRYGEELRAEAVLVDGRRLLLEIDELALSALGGIIATLPADISYIDVQVPLDALKGICITDTPGVGDIFNRFNKQVADYLLQADAIIYMVSALSPLSETEQTFLYASVLPQNISKLMVVLNMCDQLENDTDVGRLEGLVSDRLGNIFPEYSLFAVSALDEICRVRNVARPNEQLAPVLEKNFASIRMMLDSDILANRDIIRVERVQHLLRLLLQQLSLRIDLLQNVTMLDRENCEKLILEHKASNSALQKQIQEKTSDMRTRIAVMHEEAKQWMEEYLQRLRQEIARLDQVPLEILDKHFHFYFVDMIRQGLLECTNTHLRQVMRLLQDNIGQFWQQTLQHSVSRQIASAYSDISWTDYDSISLGTMTATAIGILPDFGMLTLLGQAIIGFAKERNTTGRQKQFIDGIINNYPSITSGVMSEVAAIYQQLSDYAEKQVELSYADEIKTAIDILLQAQSILDQTDTDIARSVKDLSEVKQEIHALKLRLPPVTQLSAGVSSPEQTEAMMS